MIGLAASDKAELGAVAKQVIALAIGFLFATAVSVVTSQSLVRRMERVEEQVLSLTVQMAERFARIETRLEIESDGR